MKTPTKLMFELADRTIRHAPDCNAMIAFHVSSDGEVLFSMHGRVKLLRQAYKGLGIDTKVAIGKEISKRAPKVGGLGSPER